MGIYLIFFAVIGNFGPAFHLAVFYFGVVGRHQYAVFVSHFLLGLAHKIYPKDSGFAAGVQGVYFGTIGQYGAVHYHFAKFETEHRHFKHLGLRHSLTRQQKEQRQQRFFSDRYKHKGY